MTTKADFTDDEWARLKRAPFVAGMAISLADPGGPIEAFKETAATLRTVVEAAEGDGRGELVDAIATEVAAEAKQRQSPLAGFKPRAAAEVMDELREANRVVSEKATPEDAAAFRAWLLAAAQEAADAAKEGGFFGIGAEQVSEREQKVLDQLRETLGPQA
jgi:broad specificity phosphatase PhoE